MNARNTVGYDYQTIQTDSETAAVYADHYGNFGWEMDDSHESYTAIDVVTMHFKRDRKIQNKAELTRLQRNFDACIHEIQELEKSKTTSPAIKALTVGVVGTAFMAAAIFSIVSGMTVPGVVLSVPGFIGWTLPWFLYRRLEEKKTAEIDPLVEQKYDEMSIVCEKAHALLA